MLILGFEGTAHTCGVGVVAPDPADPARCRVLANEVAMLRPAQGGIHPRAAAEHHAAALPDVVARALAAAGVAARELDGVAFSQGPGLGPCLRTVATAARALALRHDLPLLAVNHCVAHLEIARSTTPAADPVMLYASGANSQVIAEARGRYRVFGETLDIGLGNALDKFARESGIPFPGGPEIERLARAGAAHCREGGIALPTLPYSVKGMDVAFSGLVTAAHALVRDGTPLPVVCHAIEEWAFAMLIEVTERAMAYTGKDTVVLGGGVGRNGRLRAMLAAMATARGAEAHWPEPALLSDNGAMIAWCGLLMLRADHRTALAESAVRQRYRTDEVPLVWRAQAPSAARGTFTIDAEEGGFVGAEAVVTAARFLGRDVVVKQRVRKGYRHTAIEAWLVAQRTRREVQLLVAAQAAGVRVPHVLDADPDAGVLVMERIEGPVLMAALRDGPDGSRWLERAGREVARLHGAEIVHGDLTTANLLVETRGGRSAPVLIDLGLAQRRADPEAKAVDLHVMAEALAAAHPGHEALWDAFAAGYAAGAGAAADAVFAQLAELEGRGRYKSVVA